MASDKTSLGDRMKSYENVSRHSLIKRMPVIIRLDGRAFHTLTAKMQRPFDETFSATMQETAKILCEEVQGVQIAYTQSDEISLLLVDYKTHETQAWFENNIQKIVSVAASIATLGFRDSWEVRHEGSGTIMMDTNNKLVITNQVKAPYLRAFFDARVFNLPKEEVCNYFIWRQQDCTRNSIQSVGQANFSQKELHGVSCPEIQEKLFQEKQINWNDFKIKYRRGSCITKQAWGYLYDNEIPVFTQDRNYINKYVYLDPSERLHLEEKIV